jgi:hypothetical protein
VYDLGITLTYQVLLERPYVVGSVEGRSCMLRNLQKVCLCNRSSVTYSLQCTRRAYATGEKETC